MTTTEKERLSVLEEQGKRNIEDHKSIMEAISKMSCKLDTVIKEKADKVEVDDINKKLWAFATLIISSFIGLLVYMLQDKIGG